MGQIEYLIPCPLTLDPDPTRPLALTPCFYLGTDNQHLFYKQGQKQLHCNIVQRQQHCPIVSIYRDKDSTVAGAPSNLVFTETQTIAPSLFFFTETNTVASSANCMVLACQS